MHVLLYLLHKNDTLKMNKKHHLKLRGKKPFNIMSPSYQNGKCSCMRKKILNQYSTYQSFLSSLQHKELEYSYDF